MLLGFWEKGTSEFEKTDSKFGFSMKICTFSQRAGRVSRNFFTVQLWRPIQLPTLQKKSFSSSRQKTNQSAREHLKSTCKLKSRNACTTFFKKQHMERTVCLLRPREIRYQATFVVLPIQLVCIAVHRVLVSMFLECIYKFT